MKRKGFRKFVEQVTLLNSYPEFKEIWEEHDADGFGVISKGSMLSFVGKFL